MSIADVLLDKASDIGRTLAIEGIAAFASWVAHKIGADDDSTKARIMRAAIDAASLEASNRLAAGNLEERMHELAAALEGAFAHLYDAPTHPTVPPLGVPIEYITAEEAARRASIVADQDGEG